MKEVTCPHCESIFKIGYKEEDTISAPAYCPFCGESMDTEYEDTLLDNMD
jgi:hypothetical protein